MLIVLFSYTCYEEVAIKVVILIYDVAVHHWPRTKSC